ncbi:malto-oligosyltrehalose synthase [Streptomyces sp. NPDC060048]|uniref:malto-oligosyltrehalose synthase n=1 Tax=unclassified Streptomyces TaxID=2593676 RepID=UPI003683CBD8
MSQPSARTHTESDVPSAATPASTYRLQLRPDFTFADARASVPYLASLGVSHLHLSPVLEAVPGSTHGYDVTDHSRVRAELGGEAGLRSLAATARAHGLGLVLDIVPNHMAVPSPLRLNRQLWEVLRDGPDSPRARWFDIDWEAGGGQVLLPLLPGPAEAADFKADGDVLRHGELEFPLRAGTASLEPAGLLAAQFYRPAWWREARTDLNYRRFFTISELIGVRGEDPQVFAATHAKILELVRDGVVEGLRIDHVDGLADPGAYLERLRSATGPGCWIVVEKILARDERLPAAWPVAGTTGYDALRHVDGLFVDPAGAEELARRYRDSTGAADWQETAERSTREVLTVDLAAELAVLERRAGPGAARAARELLVAYPAYRPYPGADGFAEVAGASAEDVAAVRELCEQDGVFAARFAQTSAALRAKSLEDRAFYRWAPLLSATEVGGDPGRPAVSPEEFHAYCAHLDRDWPASGTVLSTHDTKRSADVRARIAVLSQAPELADEEGAAAGPDPQLAWVARQSAFGLGSVPDRTERLTGALLKAVREAALHTSWTERDERYEAGVAGYVPDLREDPPEVAAAARDNVLAMTALHLTMPGVPEVYQGCESEYRALVDPDNRRPAEPDARPEPGTLAARKLALTSALLRLRRDRPELFTGYAPLPARGPAAEHCVAYARSADLVVVVTRLSLRLAAAGGWRATTLPLPPGHWTSLDTTGPSFTGEVPLAGLLAAAPVAVLVRRA